MTEHAKDLVAFHGDEDLKNAIIDILHEHRRRDAFMRGEYWAWNGTEEALVGEKAEDGNFVFETEDAIILPGAPSGPRRPGRGCAVGCTLESVRRIEGLKSIHHSSHDLYERYLGVPEALARLEDTLFESGDKDDVFGDPSNGHPSWPERFIAAIQPGADLSLVGTRFVHWVLTDPDECFQEMIDWDRTEDHWIEAFSGVVGLLVDVIERRPPYQNGVDGGDVLPDDRGQTGYNTFYLREEDPVLKSAYEDSGFYGSALYVNKFLVNLCSGFDGEWDTSMPYDATSSLLDRGTDLSRPFDVDSMSMRFRGKLEQLLAEAPVFAEATR